MNVLVFEDDLVDNLFPVTTGRPAYAITCGSYRLVDWLLRLGEPVVGWVRPHLRDLQSFDFPQLHSTLVADQAWTLAVNARLVPSRQNFRRLRRLAEQPAPNSVRDGKSLAAAVVSTETVRGAASSGELIQLVAEPTSSPSGEPSLALFNFPHEIIRWNLECLSDNLSDRIESGRYREVAEGVFVGSDTALGDYIVTDTKAGPLVLDDHSQIGPYCYLRGPAYLGVGARVIEHAAIKDGVSLGHTTKIGGEVEASVIEPFTNKQHHGFLGHSYLGSWINLGAGTCNSDLKNTYGEVKLDFRGQKLATGMQFVGCLMGDYAKTAINTGIFTGKIIGTCSMVYGFVTTNVPSFVNYARSFGQVTELPPAVMEATQKRMFARRQVLQRPCDIQLLHDMYRLTRHERQLAEEPLVF
jgi:glucose-1-phosphate thymidylyltransferase